MPAAATRCRAHADGQPRAGARGESAHERTVIVPRARPARAAGGADRAGRARATAPVQSLRRASRCDARSVTALMMLGVRHGDEVSIRDRRRRTAAARARRDREPCSRRPRRSPRRARRPLRRRAATRLPRRRGGRPRRRANLRGVVASRGLALGAASPPARRDVRRPDRRRGAMRTKPPRLRARCATVRADLRAAARGADQTRRDSSRRPTSCCSTTRRSSRRPNVRSSRAAARVTRGARRRPRRRRALERLGRCVPARARRRPARPRGAGADRARARPRVADGPSCPTARSCWRTTCCRRSSRRSIARGSAGSARRAAARRRTSRSWRARSACRCWSPPARRIEQVPGRHDGAARRARGRLHVAPDAALRAEADASASRRRAPGVSASAPRAQREGRTADGTRVRVYANLGAPAEATRGRRARRRGLRPAAQRVPVPRPTHRARRGRAARGLPGDRDAARRAARSRSARSTSAATSRSPTCRCPPRTIPRSACAACARACIGPTCCASSCARSCASSRPASAAILLPMVTDAGEIARVRAELDASAGGELGVDARCRARRDDRDAGGGRAGRHAGAPRRLLLDRHERPDPVHARDGPHASATRRRGSTACTRPCCD